MKDRYGVFDYYFTLSYIHSLSAIYKLLSIVLLGISLIFADSLISLFVLSLYIFVIMLWSNVSFSVYYSNLKMFRFLIFFIFVVVSLFSLSLFNGFIVSLKFFDFLIYLVIITITTSLNNIVNGIYKMFRIFRNFFDVNEFSLRFGLFFKFFNVFYNEYNRVRISKRLRGVRFSDIDIIDKINYIFNDIKPVLKLTFNHLSKLKDNMYIKKYGVSAYVSNYRLNKWRKVDTMMLIVNIMLLFIIFIY